MWTHSERQSFKMNLAQCGNIVYAKLKENTHGKKRKSHNKR